MVPELIVAYAHYVSVLGLAGVLSAELLMYRRGMTAATARTLQKGDRWYGIVAALVVITGLLRVYWVGKGYAYYHANPAFHILWVMFVVVGLISIIPTMQFMKWGKGPAQGQAPTIAEGDFKKVRRILMAEVHLLGVMPLFAV